MRFVFDMSMSVEKKLKDLVEIPNELKITPSSESGRTETTYDLQAVLYHKGPSAHSGHYVADVLVPNENGDDKWWTFNDETVEEKVIESGTSVSIFASTVSSPVVSPPTSF